MAKKEYFRLLLHKPIHYMAIFRLKLFSCFISPFEC